MKHVISTIKGIAVIAIIVLLVIAVPYGCTHPTDTARVLSAAGYTNIEITGWRPFMADRNDTFSTGFSATGPGGVQVTGAVTSGLFKGHTIRID